MLESVRFRQGDIREGDNLLLNKPYKLCKDVKILDEAIELNIA